MYIWSIRHTIFPKKHLPSKWVLNQHLRLGERPLPYMNCTPFGFHHFEYFQISALEDTTESTFIF